MQKELVQALLEEKDLGKVIEQLAYLIGKQENVSLRSRLSEITDDYGRMCDFMMRGFRDEHREEVYMDLLRKAYRIAADMDMAELTVKTQAFIKAANQARNIDLQPDAIRQALEAFVQNTAVASLEPHQRRTAILAQLSEEHQQDMEGLFSALLVSRQWTNAATVRAFADMMLSPSIESNDTLLMVSALTLSCMNVFDPGKWAVLAEIYRSASEERLRQRALVGWTFCMPDKEQVLFPEIGGTVRELCSDGQTRKDLMELQMQVVFCNMADEDSEAIRREIMPSLLKNNRFVISPSGIMEKDDAMQDILDPGKEEREMEAIEKSFKRMADMQASGSDIFFSGFSQMKRFPFFNTLSNWFCPFYPEHPQLRHAGRGIKDNKIMQVIFDSGPFCDSDKYSFVLAFSSIIDKLPDNMKEMLHSAEAFGPIAGKDNLKSVAYIRRMYLQDLYRFFRVNSYRTDFINPFERKQGLVSPFFFIHQMLVPELTGKETASLNRFFYKHHQHASQTALFDKVKGVQPEQEDSENLLFYAAAFLRTDRVEEAYALFARAYDMDTENVRALKGRAQTSYLMGNYDEAENCYRKLVARNSGSIPETLSLGMTLLNNGKVDEGMDLLYRLGYEHSENPDVQRTLAWGCLVAGKPDNAGTIYSKLIGSQGRVASDFLNAGYAKWFLHDTRSAVDLFNEYVKSIENNGITCISKLQEDFRTDGELLKHYNIHDIDMKIMLDLIRRSSIS